MLDLAATVDRHQLARALERTEVLRLADPLPLDALLERHRGRHGTAALRQAQAESANAGEIVTRSELEDRFLTFLDAHDCPAPR